MRKSSCLPSAQEFVSLDKEGAGTRHPMRGWERGGTHIGRAQHHQRGFRAPARCRPEVYTFPHTTFLGPPVREAPKGSTS